MILEYVLLCMIVVFIVGNILDYGNTRDAKDIEKELIQKGGQNNPREKTRVEAIGLKDAALNRTVGLLPSKAVRGRA